MLLITLALRVVDIFQPPIKVISVKPQDKPLRIPSINQSAQDKKLIRTADLESIDGYQRVIDRATARAQRRAPSRSFKINAWLFLTTITSKTTVTEGLMLIHR